MSREYIDSNGQEVYEDDNGVTWRAPTPYAYAKACDALKRRDERIATLEGEVAHWKANHAHEVARARLLKQRRDMPVERIKAYEMIGELTEQLRLMQEQLLSLQE